MIAGGPGVDPGVKMSRDRPHVHQGAGQLTGTRVVLAVCVGTAVAFG